MILLRRLHRPSVDICLYAIAWFFSVSNRSILTIGPCWVKTAAAAGTFVGSRIAQVPRSACGAAESSPGEGPCQSVSPEVNDQQ